ncbi:MAG: ATP-binding protein [Deltaproteobacteria bacterium]|nr:ATP-binding protein [Deltaproteobacteria bacterium]
MAMPSTLALPGKLDSLYAFMDFATSCARELGFGSERIGEVELSLEEVLVNIIKHAYKECGIEGNITITCKQDAAQNLVIEIADSGTPFDISSAREPDISLDIEERQVGGLGIFFVKKLMDDVRYKREDNQNKLTLVVNNPHSSSDKQ